MGIATADVYDRLTGRQIDGREKDGLASCFTGARYNLFEVVAKFLTVQMTMCVDVLQT
jgi:hypothetical protein